MDFFLEITDFPIFHLKTILRSDRELCSRFVLENLSHGVVNETTYKT